VSNVNGWPDKNENRLKNDLNVGELEDDSVTTATEVDEDDKIEVKHSLTEIEIQANIRIESAMGADFE